MPTGRVIRFDDVRGYGFIAPDGGGEDVFVHINTLHDDKHVLSSGVPVEFEVCESDRGLKAVSVRVITKSPAVPAVASPFRDPAEPAQPWLAAVPEQPAAARERASGGVPDDGMVDVPTAEEFRREVTDALLLSAPSLTGADILRVRRCLLDVARKHGWVDG